MRRDARGIVHVAPGTLVQFDEVGVFVNCNFNEPEFGRQPYVTVNTEELPGEFVKPDGCPILAVHLNDAELYDDGGTGDTAPVPVLYVVSGFNDGSEPPAVFVRKEDAETFAATYDTATVTKATVCDGRLAAELVASRSEPCPHCNSSLGEDASGDCLTCGKDPSRAGVPTTTKEDSP
jgi:hypothetical protein